LIGTAAIGAAAVLASQGQLNIAAVLIVAAIGNEVGGLLGFQIGDRWGRSGAPTRPGGSFSTRKLRRCWPSTSFTWTAR
jgi:membrane protein DedA with SNARE-associated domain